MNPNDLLDQLQARWDKRDARYRRRRGAPGAALLTDNEVAAIVAFRQSEAAQLPSATRGTALAVLAKWTAPVAR